MPSRKIEVVLVGDASDLERSLAGALASLKAFGAGADSTGKKMDSIGAAAGRQQGVLGRLTSNWKLVTGSVFAASTGFLAITGNFAALAPLLPVVTGALTAMLVPFTSLAALVVGFIPPVTLLVGLLGGLAAVFGIGLQKALTGTSPKFAHLQHIVEMLQGRFSMFARILAHDFMPTFVFLAGSAQHAFNYLDKIAKLPLKQAFESISTTGVAGLQKFLDHVGHIIARPIRLAFQVAFGKSDTLRKALADDWNDIINFFTGKHGVLLPVEKWFGKQDFTKTGYEWASALAGATMTALGYAFKRMWATTGGKLILGGAGAGVAIGASIGGPIGAALGLAVGAAAGIALNHYWPRIKSAGISAFHTVGDAVKKALGPRLWGDIVGLAKSFWDTVKAIAGYFRNHVYPVVKHIWDALGGWHTVGVIIVGVIRIIAGAFVAVGKAVRTIYNAIQTVIHWLQRAGNYVGGAFTSVWDGVKSAVQFVAGLISTIVGDIKTAVGYAQSLASALSGGAGQIGPGGGGIGGAQSGRGNPFAHPHAAGGMAYRGQVSLVGEHGREIRLEGSNARYISNSQTERLLGGGSARPVFGSGQARGHYMTVFVPESEFSKITRHQAADRGRLV